MFFSSNTALVSALPPKDLQTCHEVALSGEARGASPFAEKHMRMRLLVPTIDITSSTPAHVRPSEGHQTLP